MVALFLGTRCIFTLFILPLNVVKSRFVFHVFCLLNPPEVLVKILQTDCYLVKLKLYQNLNKDSLLYGFKIN